MQTRQQQQRFKVSSSVPNSRNQRGGFTLVEIIIVILIILILLGFLLPAISGGNRSARVATVVAEIKNLEKAIADFKLKYGVEPPSRFILHEDAAGWADTGQLTRESRAFIRQVWPQFDFTYANTPTPGTLDINGNGSIESDGIVLIGAECLVFFLGGVCATEDASGNSLVDANGSPNGSGVIAKWVPLGFSTNPERPFARGGTRVGPFFEFDSGRLVNVLNSSFPEYLDTIPGQNRPYLFASSYGGRGYKTEVVDAGNNDMRIVRHLDLGFASGNNLLQFVYVQTGQYDDPTANPLLLTGNSIPINQNSFQIISPGFDGEYGIGGPFDSKGPRLPEARRAERDNITNFSGGMLNAN